MGIFQENLVVDKAYRQHDGQTRHDPVNLAHMRAGKLCSIGCAVNFQYAKRADNQHKGKQHPVKITERDEPPHQSPPAEPTAIVRTGFRILVPLIDVLPMAVLPIFTSTVPPCRGLSSCATSWLEAFCTSAASGAFCPIESGWFQTPASGMEPGSALSLNSKGLLRKRRCFSTYALTICAARRAASLPCSPPSNNTATTISGLRRGVTPTNQLLSANCLAAPPLLLRNILLTTWALPVLPAKSTPW